MLAKVAIENALNAELEKHLGYQKTTRARTTTR
jgi:transposase-like protein